MEPAVMMPQIVRATCAHQRLIRVCLVGIIGVMRLALLDARVRAIRALSFFEESFLGRQQNMVSPAPADQLAQLLEDKQIENPPRGYLIVVVVRDAVPVEAFEGLRERDHEGNGEGVGVAKHLMDRNVSHNNSDGDHMITLTAMAATKLDLRFLNRKHLETRKEQEYETTVWTTKITGMIARSVSFSAVSCEPSLVKTTLVSQSVVGGCDDSRVGFILRQGVKRVTLRLASSFWASASNMP
jgi:hypothetical protein